MRSDGVGELARLLDLAQRDQDLRRHLLVELHILLELLHDGAGQRLDLARIGDGLGEHLGLNLEEARIVDEGLDAGAGGALDQHLDGAVGQLQELQHARHGADAVDVVAAGIVLARALLGDEQDLLVVLHHLLEGLNRLLATDEQRNDHVREDDDVPEWQDGEDADLRGIGHATSLRLGGRHPAAQRKPTMKVAAGAGPFNPGTGAATFGSTAGACQGRLSAHEAEPTSPFRSA